MSTERKEIERDHRDNVALRKVIDGLDLEGPIIDERLAGRTSTTIALDGNGVTFSKFYRMPDDNSVYEAQVTVTLDEFRADPEVVHTILQKADALFAAYVKDFTPAQA